MACQQLPMVVMYEVVVMDEEVQVQVWLMALVADVPVEHLPAFYQCAA